MSFSRAIGYDPNYSVFTNLNNTTPTFTYGGHWMYWKNPGAISGTSLSGGNGRPYVKYASNGTNTVWFATTEDSPQNYANSLYVGNPAGRAYKVSYNRPFTTRTTASGQDWVFNAEYPMVRWLEANGYDVSYTSGVDTDRRAASLLVHKLFVSVGHDEYWSGTQRANVEAARAAGVHLESRERGAAARSRRAGPPCRRLRQAFGVVPCLR